MDAYRHVRIPVIIQDWNHPATQQDDQGLVTVNLRVYLRLYLNLSPEVMRLRHPLQRE